MGSYRILQLISSGGFYGAENMVVQLSRALKKLDCEVVVGVFRNAHCKNIEVAEKAREYGLEVEFIECSGRFDLEAIGAIRTSLVQRHIDILHTHGYKADIYGWCAARRSGAKLVATCHNWPSNELTLRGYAILDRFLLRRFSAIVAVSDPVEKTLHSAGVATSKVSVINNGIDVGCFSDSEVKPHSDLDKWSGVQVGLVGRLTREKGGEYLLQAAAQVIPYFPNTILAFVGDGPFREELKNFARKLGIERSVTFLGRCADMASVYAALDVIVLPSITEGLPLSILEAMAAGKAIVASQVGSIPKVLSDGITGLLVPPADVAALRDALKRILENAELRKNLGHCAREHARQAFSATRMAQEYSQVYETVLSNTPQRSHLSTATSAA